MRIWGYLLIFLNIVAAGAFTYYATAVWSKRLDWQYALLKQEIVNRGLPLEASELAADDLEEGSVAFYYKYSNHTIAQISKERLKKYLPAGGTVLGQKSGDPVTNQSAEVKRVEKIVFDELDAIKEPLEKRGRLMILLLNLAKGSGRQGTYALLRDLPEPFRHERARREIAHLGKSAPQVSALWTLAALADVQTALGMNADPLEIAARTLAGRKALAAWALSEVPNAAPDPWVPVNPPPPPSDDPPAKNENRERLQEAVALLATELGQEKPDPAQITAGVTRIKGLLDGEPPAVTTPEAKFLIPYITEIASHLLATPEDIIEVKKKLLELAHERARTDAEKKSLTALADLMIPAKLDLPADSPQEKILEAKAAQFQANLDTAATELLRSYFDEANGKTTTSETLPEEIAQARAKLAGNKSLVDPEEKRRNIAHLLYHLDAHLGGEAERRLEWFKLYVLRLKKEDAPEDVKLPAVDANLLENRLLWHQRVAAIIGFEAYIATTEAQATEFAQMTTRLRSHILQEQSAFEVDYQAIVQRALYLAVQLGIREVEQKDQQAKEKEHKEQLDGRLVEKDVLVKDLARVTANTTTALNELDAKVEDLFQITKRYGEAQDALLGLELQLRDMELGNKQRKQR